LAAVGVERDQAAGGVEFLAQRGLVMVAGRDRGDGGVQLTFQPAIAADGENTLDRVVALLGRSPDWPA
jgi:hypothetical protein